MATNKKIQENGMSMKIIQFCNESKNFKAKFLEILRFDKLGKVDYIEFTGYKNTGDVKDGKPDITIRFNNGEYCFIEVKTDGNTDFTVKQIEEAGYAKQLVEKNKVDINDIKEHVESHFCFLLDPIHYDKIEKTIQITYNRNILEIPVISWEKIYQIVDDFGNRSLARDIEENVSGIKKDTTKDSFSAYDLSLLYNSKLLDTSIKKLSEIDFKRKDIVNNKLNSILIDPSILDNLSPEECNRGCWFVDPNKKNKNNYKQIFLGFSHELLTWKILNRKENDFMEDFLCSVAVDKELINLKKLEESKEQYWEDENRWIYLPVDDKDLNIDSNTSFSHVNFDKFDYKLDICHSLITLDRINKLIEASKEQIIKELEEKVHGISIGRSYNYNNKENMPIVGYYLKKYGKGEVLYFGLAPNIFEEKEIDEKILPNYFSCVGIFQAPEKISEKGLFINEGVLFQKKSWIYFPISKKNLCLDDFVKAYANNVVRLLKDAIDNYGTNISN